MRRVAIISGYANVCHRGHIEYARLAKEFVGPDGFVYFIVNSDKQSMLKKGYIFVPEEDRLAIMGALKYVDEAILSIDLDRSVCKTIEMLCMRDIKPTHFLNGGDVTVDKKCPEEDICIVHGIDLLYGFGEKIQSSSWILEKSVVAAYNVMTA
jgi:cytidyltransferase-like protein